MTTEHVNSGHILSFADNNVNLKREDAAKYREQVGRLREKLEQKLREEPDYKLRRMILSGSLAKGTALKTLNDIDVALYVKQDNPPAEMAAFLEWLVSTLRDLYPNMDASQIVQQDHSVRISFRGSGLDVDIVPISYDGNDEWDGDLYSSSKREWVKTNIDKHLVFIRKRKQRNNPQFAQVVRLVKFWIKGVKKQDSTFRFKSFMAELLLAHLSDKGGINFGDYIEALAGFFNFIVRGGLKERIVFGDYYSPASAASSPALMQIFDPVNENNNVADGYGQSHMDAIEKASGEAADAIDAALYAPTKGETLAYWRKVFGPSFGV